MTTYTLLLRTLGLAVAAFLIAAVMLDSAGYRWCDTYSDPACTSTTGVTEVEVR